MTGQSSTPVPGPPRLPRLAAAGLRALDDPPDSGGPSPGAPARTPAAPSPGGSRSVTVTFTVPVEVAEATREAIRSGGWPSAGSYVATVLARRWREVADRLGVPGPEIPEDPEGPPPPPWNPPDPALVDTGPTTQLHVRLPEATVAWLDALAARLNRPRAAVLRHCLLDEHPPRATTGTPDPPPAATPDPPATTHGEHPM